MADASSTAGVQNGNLSSGFFKMGGTPNRGTAPQHRKPRASGKDSGLILNDPAYTRKGHEAPLPGK